MARTRSRNDGNQMADFVKEFAELTTSLQNLNQKVDHLTHVIEGNGGSGGLKVQVALNGQNIETLQHQIAEMKETSRWERGIRYSFYIAVMLMFIREIFQIAVG